MIMSNSNESRRTPSSNNSGENGSELKKGPWTLEEDNLLIQYINCHGEGRWNSLAKYAGLNRTGKSCRLRWLNYLKPDIKRGNFTPHEQILILELHSKWGNRWSKIAQNLPGRTDNEIKNYWRTRVQKQARQLKIDSNSNKFLEAIRMYWMPRLLEKIEQNNIRNNNSSSSSVIQNNSSSPVPVNNYQNYSAEPVVVSNVVNNINKNGEKSVEEDDCYYVEAVPSYDDDMRELESSSQDISMSECHVGGIDWLGDDLVGSTAFWNTTADDELLWRFN